MSFRFGDFGRLSDGTIDLVLLETKPADPAKGWVPSYNFQIVLHGEATPIGEIRLRVGTSPGLLTSGHIGYGIDEPHRGHRYAQRACAMLAPVARYHGLEKVIITCAPENIPSRRTCEHLGARLLGIYDVPPDHDMFLRGRRKVCRYEWDLTTSA